MVFSSTEFLFIFLPIVLIIYFNPVFKGRKFRNYFLLLASLAFYAWGEPVFVFVMILSIVVNWFFALRINQQEDPRKRKWLLLPPLLFDIILLFLFKYLSFATKNLGLLLGKEIHLEIALPIGISFFTFKLMSYILDVYNGKAQAQKNLLNVALYISFFSKVTAGPIIRYQTIANEITERLETKSDFTKGVSRFVFGLGKKVLLANYLAVIVDNIFILEGDMSVATAWLGVIAFALQVYFDFSGYSDMAIGLGQIFGFHFEENFNYPFIANSITDFWRRWHISLSAWFRDYVYIPLGGNRVSKKRWVFNLFIIWFLTGFWHGANWTYIAWGLYYYVFIILERMVGIDKKTSWFSHVYTIFVVLFGFAIFRSESLTASLRYIGVMLGFGAKSFSDQFFLYYLNGGKWVLLASVFFALPIRTYLTNISKALRDRQGKLAFLGNPNFLIALKVIALIFVFVNSVLIVVNSTYNPFIYFNF